MACRTLANLFPTQSVKMLPEGVNTSTFCLKKIRIRREVHICVIHYTYILYTHNLLILFHEK